MVQAEGEGKGVSFREIWRSFVLYGLFAVLVIAGFHELPEGETILSWYIIIASAAVPATIARFWR